jgi:hypothetical protein
VNTTIDELSDQEHFTLTAGPTDNNAFDGAIIVVPDASDSTRKCYAVVDDYQYAGGDREVTLPTTPTFNIAEGDRVDVIAVK